MLHSINFLRFIACLGVVSHHALGFTSTPISVGAAGIDLFFVLSGVTIAYACDGAPAGRFLIRRFIRVFPLYWLATLAYLGFKYYEWHDLPQAEPLWRSMLLLPDFGAGWNPIYYPAWALAYGLLFYLIFGLLLALVRRHVAAIAAVVLCGLSVVLIPVPGREGAQFDTRLLFEFALGIAFALSVLKGRVSIDARTGTASLVAALAILVLNHKSNGIDRALAWGVPSLLLVIGLHARESSGFFRRPAVVLLGKASYAIFLVHITVIELILETLKRSDVAIESLKAAWPLTFLMLVGAAIGFGVLVHLFVERPLLGALGRLIPSDSIRRVAEPEPVVDDARLAAPSVPGTTPKLEARHMVAPALMAAAFLVWVVGRAFDWPAADDFLLVDWYRKFFITGELSLGDVLAIKNGPHPVGFQALVTVLLFKVFGVSFNLLVGLNILIAAACGLLVSAVVLSDSASRPGRWITPVLLMAVFLHPNQMNHLVWPFELGWFMVTLALVTNIVLVEFRGARAVPWVAVVCLLGTLSTGQGGFLWLLAAFHFLLLGGPRRYLTAGGFLAAFVAVSAYLTSSTGEVSGLMKDGVGGLILYFAQLFGGVFGVRGTRSTWVLGALVLAFALGLSGAALARNRASRPTERAGMVLVAGALLMAAGFMLARYKFGIVWALDRFHAAPLLVPVLAGIVVLASRYLESGASLGGRGLALLAQAGVVASVVTAAGYATERFDEQITARGFGMAVVCDKQDDAYLEIAASGLAEWSFFLVTHNREALAGLCTDALPADSRALLKPPDDFAGLIARDPAVADGLTALWRVYQTHGDLQRAFPVRQPDLGRNLLMFASNNARSGSQYEKDILGPHADVYIRLYETR